MEQIESLIHHKLYDRGSKSRRFSPKYESSVPGARGVHGSASEKKKQKGEMETRERERKKWENIIQKKMKKITLACTLLDFFLFSHECVNQRVLLEHQ